MKMFMKVLSCTILALLFGTGFALCGDLDILEQLGQTCRELGLRVENSEGSHVCLTCCRQLTPKSHFGCAVEYVEIDRDGRQIARWAIDVRDINTPTFLNKGKQGQVLFGLGMAHGPQVIRTYDMNGSIVREDTLSDLRSSPYRTCTTPDGDLLLCEWGRDRLFWRMNTAGEYSSFGNAAVREAYHDLGSYHVMNPKLVHMSTNNQILLGSYQVDLSGGPGNRKEMYNSFLVCVYDIDSNRIVKHREYDLLNDPCVELTGAHPPWWQASIDSAGVTTIFGRYRDEDNISKLFVLAVDSDLNPVQTQQRRVERFEGRVDYDRTEPHHDFYYLWAEPNKRIWLGHIISTPEVIYHAEYETLKE
jgi:hypothetical protein